MKEMIFLNDFNEMQNLQFFSDKDCPQKEIEFLLNNMDILLQDYDRNQNLEFESENKIIEFNLLY